jgi:hypothetical protein
MSCERFREAIAGHAAGADLNPAAAAHLGSCEACATRLETQRRLLADVDAELAGTLSLSASPAFVARVTSSVSATRRRSIAWRPAAAWVGLAAAAAIVVVSLLRGPDPAVSPAPRESAVAAPAPATPPAVAETGAPSVGHSRSTRPQRGPRRPAAAPRVEEPPVIVDAGQARAIARLREALRQGRLTEETLPRPQTQETAFAGLLIPPLEVSEISVPDVEIVSRPPAASQERQ